MDRSTPLEREDFLSIAPQQEWDLGQEIQNELRRTEFLKGRLLAHILSPGLPTIGRRSKGNDPLWPNHILGSISHKRGDVVTCVTARGQAIGLGIDIEDPTLFPEKVEKAICTPEDLTLLRANLSKYSSQSLVIASAAKQSPCKGKIASSPTAPHNDEIGILRQVGARPEESLRARPSTAEKTALTLIFSLKEALFKSLFPTTRVWFGFQDAYLAQWDDSSREAKLVLKKDLTLAFPAGHIFKAHYDWIELSSIPYLLCSLLIE
ncbi:MAG: 4'-phosphopantetheinyl transferase superfamily protein [Oligoflexales bacterium]|nr:4'-phosphopantetheinyl transferase superfamily protein [Oligoflexales bacterium]